MKDNMINISKTCDRWQSLCDKHQIKTLDRMSLFMDIDYSDQDCPINFDALLKFDDIDFAHDIGGIVRHFDRTALKLDAHFIPRAAQCNFMPVVS